MKRITLLAAALAALIVVTGAAAATPGSTGAADSGTAAQADTGAADGADSAGPPDDLPGPVPDFVSEIHGLIQQFVDGTLDSLGPSVSDAGGEDAGTSTATPTA
ncbi:MAG: hypothetical protein ABEI27_06555 [Halobellus sp.]|uniref:hypothetical protein n=1 Tax=Halobellus sp. TaxID=1979212 RepID=UPI0035D413DF